MNVDELKDRISAHSAAVIAGGKAAESFVIPAKLELWRAGAAALEHSRPVRDCELMACARIGRHFMAKTRFHGRDGAITLLVRWKEVDGKWMIADAEDITGKRSPWSDIPHYSKERGTNA
jgi:hypothetical protein